MSTRRRPRPQSATAWLEEQRVDVTLSLGAGAQIEASAVPLERVGTLVRYAVALRRSLIAEGLEELLPHDVTNVPADRVDVPDEYEDAEAALPTVPTPPRVGFVP